MSEIVAYYCMTLFSKAVIEKFVFVTVAEPVRGQTDSSGIVAGIIIGLIFSLVAVICVALLIYKWVLSCISRYLSPNWYQCTLALF